MGSAVCVFCRRGKSTEEHLVGRWIGELFPGPHPGSFAALGRKGIQEKIYPAKLFNQTVYAACGKCNNGWMSAMENSVKGFLGPMILEGKPTQLSPKQQHNLASWTLKTALVYDCLQTASRQVPPKSYPEFYSARQPSHNYLIWVGHRGVIDKDDAGNQFIARIDVKTIGRVIVPARRADELREEFKQGTMFSATIGLGRVALQVFGHTHRHRIVLTRPDIGVLIPIWPTGGYINWPPQIGIERIGGFKGLRDSIET
jgi:hypothetical protein